MKNRVLVCAAIAFLGAASSVVQAAPVNVAQLYGTASAHTTYSTHVPALAIDGNEATYWNTNGGSPLSIDLGKVFQVSKISLLRELPDGRYSGELIPYVFHSSLDGSAWDLIGSRTFINDVDDRHDYLFTSGLSMQYFKYQATGPSPWVGLAEVQIFAETSTTAAVPEPGSLALIGLALGGLGLARRRKS